MNAELTEERIVELLDEYIAERQIKPIDHEDFAGRHPPHAERLLLTLPTVDRLYGFEPPTPKLSGRRLGDFLIGEEIGRGGMGIVYAAHQSSLGRPVALKVLPGPATLDENQVARFSIEAHAAASLHHPHIVPVHWFGVVDDVHCYAMARIDGRSIEDEQNAGDPGGVAIGRACRLIADAADALHHAHDRGVIHRDIKPSNLMIDVEDKIWITDFGLARIGQRSDVSRTGEVVGSRRTMSPEQAAGHPAAVDHRSDIYSLGATLYRWLTGVDCRPAADWGTGTRSVIVPPRGCAASCRRICKPSCSPRLPTTRPIAIHRLRIWPTICGACLPGDRSPPGPRRCWTEVPSGRRGTEWPSRRQPRC